MLHHFQDSFIYGEPSFSYFFRVITSTQQLPFQRSCFFRASAFLTSSFFRTVRSSQQLFFQNSYFFTAKVLPNSHHLRKGCSSGYLLFRTATIFVKELFRIKISTEELLYGKNEFFRKAIFRITNFFWRATLLERLLFQKNYLL